jgi:proteasome lid subunit RPN8/RPN11
MEGLSLSRAHLDRMRAHISALAPLEACGLLAALPTAGGKAMQVAEVIPVRNSAESPVRFFMDPAEQLKAFDWMERQGMQLAGIYHSHPDGPEGPSATDLEEAAYQVVYIIWSRPGGAWQARAFRIVDAQAHEVSLRILDEQ